MQLISWNIQWGRGADGRVDLDRVVAQARALADFDVLCLQEVSSGYPELPGCDGSDQFAALAQRLGGYSAVPGVATDTLGPDGRRRRFGNMVFSRYPVLRVLPHLLPWPADAQVASMQRLALEVTLALPSGPLRVTTTHLAYYSARQRAAQIERLRELHAEAVAQAALQWSAPPADGPFVHVPRGGRAVLTGDFNCRPDSPEYRRLQEPLAEGVPPYVDAWRLLYPQQPHAPTVGVHDRAQWPGPPFTFDFVFVSADLAPCVRALRVDAQADGSDHQPVLLTLDV